MSFLDFTHTRANRVEAHTDVLTDPVTAASSPVLLELVERAVAVKARVVGEDLREGVPEHHEPDRDPPEQVQAVDPHPRTSRTSRSTRSA